MFVKPCLKLNFYFANAPKMRGAAREASGVCEASAPAGTAGLQHQLSPVQRRFSRRGTQGLFCDVSIPPTNETTESTIPWCDLSRAGRRIHRPQRWFDGVMCPACVVTISVFFA